MSDKPAVTLEMIALLLQSSNQLQEANHKSTNEKIDKLAKDLEKTDKKVNKQCEECPKILDLKTRIGYLNLGLWGLSMGLIGLAKLGYDFQGKILEYIGGWPIR